MTLHEYYKIVADKWEKTDKTDREVLHRFNEWKRQLRKTVNNDGDEY